jgi:hypothetical protein
MLRPRQPASFLKPIPPKDHPIFVFAKQHICIISTTIV